MQVISGGVASNEYIRTKLRLLLHHYDITLHCPPPRLCTDNGVMIAWLGTCAHTHTHTHTAIIWFHL